MNPVDKISYEYAKEHGVVGLDYEKVYDAVKYGYNHAIEDAWKPSGEQMEALENVIKCELSSGLHTRAEILQTLQNELKKL